MRHRPLAVVLLALAAVLVAGATSQGAARPTAVAAPAEVPSSATLVSGEPAGDSFGASVALAGDGRTAVVGAPSAKGGQGAAWIFRLRNGRWGSGSRLSAGPRAGKVFFGRSVAISADGKLVLVGAPGKHGDVWAFRRASGGVWVGGRLPHPSGSLPTAFGWDVALSTDATLALVGAPGDGRGTASLYRRTGSTWRGLGAKLTGDHVAGGALFGYSVALSGDGTIGIVGAPLDGKGSASAFALLGSTWRRQGGKLRGGDPLETGHEPVKSRFGFDVALARDGRRAIVGAPDDIVYGSRQWSGAAWVFSRVGTTWTRRGAVSAYGQRRFGRSIALSANVRVSLVAAVGLTEVWRRDSSGVWLDHRVVEAYDETFGSSTAVDADGVTAILGAPGTASRKGRAIVISPVLKGDKPALPLVTQVAPGFGPTVGGTQVTIRGENFMRVRSVSFGARAARSFTVLSPTTIGAVAPAGQIGAVDVVVRTANGSSPPVRPGWGSGLDSRFSYLDPPVVRSVTPSSGPAAGGTEVAIVGSGFAQGAAVRFGGTNVTSTVVESATRITAVSPPGQAGTVDVTVRDSSTGLTSLTSGGDRFSYVSSEHVITFDDLVTGGRDGFGALVRVSTQYAGQGVTFNDVSAIDYSKGPSALAGFPRSGVAIEQCVGVENCTTPIRVDFAEPQRLTRVWVGFSFRIEHPLQVQLAAYDAGGVVVALTSTTLLTNDNVTPIRVPLEISLATPAIRRIELSVPGGGFTGGLAVDDVTFQGS